MVKLSIDGRRYKPSMSLTKFLFLYPLVANVIFFLLVLIGEAWLIAPFAFAVGYLSEYFQNKLCKGYVKLKGWKGIGFCILEIFIFFTYMGIGITIYYLYFLT